jgi:soluble lytic murein transglycosylase-like protein
MRNLRGTYVHRGDGPRRRHRHRRYLVAAGLVASIGLVAWNRAPAEAKAEPSSDDLPFYVFGEARKLKSQLDATKGSLDLVTAQLDRANKVIEYSTRYRIAADLASSIIDIASAEGIAPDLAFRLVKLESGFNERAKSPVGAIGLTQVMLPTARYFDRTITEQRLYDRRTNLRIGFRYLRGLIDEHDGDVRLALLVYNRGPVAVQNALRAGLNPTNGYDRIIMKGYDGPGTVD